MQGGCGWGEGCFLKLLSKIKYLPTLRHWGHWGEGRFGFVVVVGYAPFAGFAAEGGGVVGAEVVFDGVPEVEDEGIDGGALVADGFLADVVGGFGGGLGCLPACICGGPAA